MKQPKIRKLVIDNFAGGGGTSTGLEIGLGRSVDIAINHDQYAIAMHKMNHPETQHYCEDVWHVDPVAATQGMPVGLVWLSPDCTHHSQAAGGQPRDKVIRGLAWVGKKWAGKVLPDVIMLENVVQILQWGPLIAKRDPATGRVIKLDKTVAAVGERVPVQEQFLVPNKAKQGRSWNAFVRDLKALGYVVEHKKLKACDFGAPTTRERLFMVARRDGKPIVWPEPTNFKTSDKPQFKWRAAAECIDWNLPCPSIFTRKRGLATATLRRVARGIQKYVVDSGDPFIVPIAHYNGTATVHDINEPLRTIMAATKGGEFALAAPVLAKLRGDSIGTRMDEPVPTITSGGNSKRPAGSPHALGLVSPIMVQAGHGEGQAGKAQRWGSGHKSPEMPLGTIVASGGGHALASAYLMQANGGFNTTPGHPLSDPVSTITNSGSQQQLIMANMVTLRKDSTGSDLKDPLATITASGEHHALVAASMVVTGYGEREGQAPRTLDIEAPLGTVVGQGKHAVVAAELDAYLSSENLDKALKVSEFMFQYSNNTGTWAELSLQQKLDIVTVNVQGVPHVIIDIGLRMMAPRELYTAQGFPDNYVIDHGAGGVIFSKSTQVKLVGNSVSPVIPAALARANCPDMVEVEDMTIYNWEKAA